VSSSSRVPVNTYNSHHTHTYTHKRQRKIWIKTEEEEIRRILSGEPIKELPDKTKIKWPKKRNGRPSYDAPVSLTVSPPGGTLKGSVRSPSRFQLNWFLKFKHSARSVAYLVNSRVLTRAGGVEPDGKVG
jgi:hypothetical protein